MLFLLGVGLGNKPMLALALPWRTSGDASGEEQRGSCFNSISPVKKDGFECFRRIGTSVENVFILVQITVQ